MVKNMEINQREEINVSIMETMLPHISIPTTSRNRTNIRITFTKTIKG